jgi:hypothetical protein
MIFMELLQKAMNSRNMDENKIPMNLKPICPENNLFIPKPSTKILEKTSEFKNQRPV